MDGMLFIRAETSFQIANADNVAGQRIRYHIFKRPLYISCIANDRYAYIAKRMAILL